MSLKFPSPEWLAEFKQQINSSSAYAEAAKTWEGDLNLIVDPSPGIPEPVVIYLDLWHVERSRCARCKVLHQWAAGKLEEDHLQTDRSDPGAGHRPAQSARQHGIHHARHTASTRSAPAM